MEIRKLARCQQKYDVARSPTQKLWRLKGATPNGILALVLHGRAEEAEQDQRDLQAGTTRGRVADEII